MYHVPNTYPFFHHYPSTTNPMTRNQQDYFELIQTIIEKDASAIDYFNRLAYEAPNQHHQHLLLRIIENKKVQLQQLSNLYTSLTGTYPLYQIEQVPIQSYEEGLQKAYQAEIEKVGEYRNQHVLQQFPQLTMMLTDDCATQLRMLNEELSERIRDYGGKPYVLNIEKATKQNKTFRTAIWTGKHLQVTLMSVGVGEDIGIEIHPKVDQFLRIEEGQGLVQMGERKNSLNYVKKVYDDYAIMIPAGTWHNVKNTGTKPLKLYSIYAPPEHPFGTMHKTKKDALAAESMIND